MRKVLYLQSQFGPDRSLPHSIAQRVRERVESGGGFGWVSGRRVVRFKKEPQPEIAVYNASFEGW